MIIHIFIGIMVGIPIGYATAVLMHTGKEADK